MLFVEYMVVSDVICVCDEDGVCYVMVMLFVVMCVWIEML